MIRLKKFEHNGLCGMMNVVRQVDVVVGHAATPNRQAVFTGGRECSADYNQYDTDNNDEDDKENKYDDNNNDYENEDYTVE